MVTLEHRKVGIATAVRLVLSYGGFSTNGGWKVIPPILEYDGEGGVRLVTVNEVLENKVHPYRAGGSPDFTETSVDSGNIRGFYRSLEHFPTLEEGNAFAELIYGGIVYLRPTADVEEQLRFMGFLERGTYKTQLLQGVVEWAEEQFGRKIDLWSVPKRKIGTMAYVGGDDYGDVVKRVSFGYHTAIPNGRVARELSSLKSAERFINPVHVEGVEESLRPYTTMLRVGIVSTKFDMLDSTDIYPSAKGKIACNLQRTRTVTDVSNVPMAERNVVVQVTMGSMEIAHQYVEEVDERTVSPGAIRFVFPAGVKVAGGWMKEQAFDDQDQPIDMLMDFRTIARKGAVALFPLGKGEKGREQDAKWCWDYFMSLEKERIVVGQQTYWGYCLDLPVWRPGQRYTELCKVKSLPMDLISIAQIGGEFKVSGPEEEEYGQIHRLFEQLTR